MIESEFSFILGAGCMLIAVIFSQLLFLRFLAKDFVKYFVQGFQPKYKIIKTSKKPSTKKAIKNISGDINEDISEDISSEEITLFNDSLFNEDEEIEKEIRKVRRERSRPTGILENFIEGTELLDQESKNLGLKLIKETEALFDETKGNNSKNIFGTLLTSVMKGNPQDIDEITKNVDHLIEKFAGLSQEEEIQPKDSEIIVNALHKHQDDTSSE